MNAHETTTPDMNAPETSTTPAGRSRPDGPTRGGMPGAASGTPRAATRRPAALGVAGVALAAASFPGVTLAYVGPGAGLGAIGTLFGIVAAVVLAMFGLFWYPLKRMLGRRSATTGGAAETPLDAGGTANAADTDAASATAARAADTGNASAVEGGTDERGNVPPR